MYKTFIFVAIMMIRSCGIISLSLRPLKTTSVEHAQSFRSHYIMPPLYIPYHVFLNLISTSIISPRHPIA
jgi:hypothetical protein